MPQSNRKNIYAEIITIGDELLYGQVLDTNSQWISYALDMAGIKTIRKTTVPDLEPEILNAFEAAEKRADIILITGGLGPTDDDLTKAALAKYFDSPLVMNAQALQELTALFEKRGLEVTELNRQQSELPEKCSMISNPVGSAAGMWFEKEGKVFVSMPGVPHEMKKMVIEQIIPRLIKLFDPPVIYHKTINIVGIGESWLAAKIKAWEGQLPAHIKLAYLPGLSQVKLRLTAFGKDMSILKSDVALEIEKVMPLIEKYVFGFDEETLEGQIGKLLIDSNKTLTIAESCTGGYIAHAITSVPGSSAYFMGGIVPYNNTHKINILGVKASTIEQYGAVSEETVREMAHRTREMFHTDIALSSSGIAGPDGGTPEKPVGTVWIGLADGEQTITKKLNLNTDRGLNIKLSSVAALSMLWESLKKKD